MSKPRRVEGRGRAINLHLYPSGIRFESRMFKETLALRDAELFDEIILAGVSEDGLATVEALDPRRSIHRLETWSGSGRTGRLRRLIHILEWSCRVWRRYSGLELAAVSCHNLAAVPVGVLLKLSSGAILVYDTHELETERRGWSVLLRGLGKLAERALMPFVDYIVVVSQSIAEWYHTRHPQKRLRVVRNVPLARLRRTEPPVRTDLRRLYNVPPEAVLYLMQGVMGPGRGIEALVEAFRSLRSQAWLVLLGFAEPPEYEAHLGKLVATCSRVVRHAAVAPDELLDYTESADVGVYSVEPVSLSYQLTIGNKLFEYLSAGLPVIGSDFPEIRRFLMDEGCGWTTEISPGGLRDLIDAIRHEDIEEKKRRVQGLRASLTWEVEVEPMVNDYRELMAKTGRGAAR